MDEIPDNRSQIDNEDDIALLLVNAYPTRTGALGLEMRSDNVDENQIPNYEAYNPSQEEYYRWQPETYGSNDGTQYLWSQIYHAIANANHALEALEKMGSSENLSAYKAEALMCRAYGHFLLVTSFCMPYGNTSEKDLGIPYSTKPEKEVNPEYDRGTVSYVYELINKDIEEALPYIQDFVYEVPGYHFNVKAAHAFAARFNLYYQKWDKAIQYATKALGNNPKRYLRDWAYHGKLSSNNLSRPDDFINVNNPATFLVQSTFSYFGRIYYKTKFSHHRVISDAETLHSKGPWGNHENLLVRPITFQAPNPTVAVRKVNEYWEYTNITAGTGYAHVMQAVFTGDETLLCRAEAYIHLKQFDKALDDLNMFMTNYMNCQPVTIDFINDFYGKNMEYYTPTKPTAKKKFNADFPIEEGTQENLLHFILHLRRVLTLHEGLRMHDVNRYGIEIYRRVIDVNNKIAEVTDTMEKGDPRRAMQLPQSVIAAGAVPNPQ